jgi:hypothetical protein
MERASVATDGDSRTAMDGPNPKQSCPLEWVPQALIELLWYLKEALAKVVILVKRGSSFWVKPEIFWIPA